MTNDPYIKLFADATGIQPDEVTPAQRHVTKQSIHASNYYGDGIPIETVYEMIRFGWALYQELVTKNETRRDV